MSLIAQPAAYKDCYDVFSAAVSAPSGVRIPFPAIEKAKLFQLRMHKARQIMRDQSRRAYDRSSKLYDTSEFDSLQVRVIPTPDDEGFFWVYIEPHGLPDVLSLIEPINPAETLELPADEIPEPTAPALDESDDLA